MDFNHKLASLLFTVTVSDGELVAKLAAVDAVFRLFTLEEIIAHTPDVWRLERYVPQAHYVEYHDAVSKIAAVFPEECELCKESFDPHWFTPEGESRVCCKCSKSYPTVAELWAAKFGLFRNGAVRLTLNEKEYGPVYVIRAIYFEERTEEVFASIEATMSGQPVTMQAAIRRLRSQK